MSKTYLEDLNLALEDCRREPGWESYSEMVSLLFIGLEKDVSVPCPGDFNSEGEFEPRVVKKDGSMAFFIETTVELLKKRKMFADIKLRSLVKLMMEDPEVDSLVFNPGTDMYCRIMKTVVIYAFSAAVKLME